MLVNNTFVLFTDLSVSTGCCEALNHIVTFLFTNWQKATKSDNPMKEITDHPALKILEIRSEIFQQVFRGIAFSLLFLKTFKLYTNHLFIERLLFS